MVINLISKDVISQGLQEKMLQINFFFWTYFSLFYSPFAWINIALPLVHID